MINVSRVRERSLLILAVLVLLIVVAYPLSKIILQSFKFDQRLSFLSYLQIFSQRGNYIAMRHSLEISLLTTLFAALLGTLLAWVVARTDCPGKSFFRTLFILPFITPPFIGAFAWRMLLGPVGYFNKAYMALSGAEAPLWNFYGADGIIIVMSLHLYPLVYISTLGALERMNPELEEAAQISGSPVFAVMRHITLPLMMPAILSGVILVFIASIANFGIPAILGFPANYYVLTTKIWEAISMSSQPNSLSVASSLSVVLGLVAGLGLILHRFYLKGREYAVISGKSMHPNLVLLGSHKSWIVPLLALVVFITSFAPLIAILLTSLTKALGLAPVPKNLTLQNFYDVLVTNRTARRAIRNSLVLALSSATIISFLGALIAYIVVKTRLRGRLLIDFISSMPYALPGTVVGVAMILAWLKPIPLIHVRIYNTLWILLMAYIARYMAFGVRTISASLQQIHVSMEEAARISGATWLQTFRDIVIPLIAPGLFASWFLVFMPTLRELTISILLWSTRHETIGVMVFNLQESGNTVASAALAMVMMLVLFIANIITKRLTRGRVGF